jgi:hypothetical protein
MFIVTHSQTPTICYNPTNACFDPTVTQSLLFQSEQLTTCNRVVPIQQLTCVGDTNLCDKNSEYITSIKCINGGIDSGGNVIWNCEGNKPTSVSFGKETVSCEGCTSSTDKLKIQGSCALFYQLQKTVLPISNPTSNTNNESDENVFVSLLIVIVLLIVVFGLVAMCISCVKSDHYTCSSNLRSSLHASSYVPVATVESTIPSAPPTSYQSSYQSSYVQPTNLSRTTYVQSNQSRNTRNNDGSILTGYIVGEEMKQGNYGAAMLTQSLAGGGSGSNYNTGVMMGLMSGGNNGKHHASSFNTPKHHGNNGKHHASSFNTPKHHGNKSNSEGNYDIDMDSGTTFANSTTR